MSEQELARLVEKIVLRVLEKIQADEQLAHLVKSDEPDKSQWARTCSTYRHEETPVTESSIPVTAQSFSAAPPPTVNTKVQTPTKRLYTERDILELSNNGQSKLVISKKTILTPSAVDAAKSKAIEIIIKD